MVDLGSFSPSSKCLDDAKSVSNSFLSNDQSFQMKQTPQSHRLKKQNHNLNSLLMPPCEGSIFVAFDIVLVIAVLGACGFLLYPCFKLVTHGITKFGHQAFDVVRSEVYEAPLVYASLALSVASATVTVWWLFHCSMRKCDKPNCRGLRGSAEFIIEIETEDSVGNFSSRAKIGMGMFDLVENYHKELEAELKKMAPTNGKAVLVFRARCGCSVGRMEVWGPKKIKKIKKTSRRKRLPIFGGYFSMKAVVGVINDPEKGEVSQVWCQATLESERRKVQGLDSLLMFGTASDP